MLYFDIIPSSNLKQKEPKLQHYHLSICEKYKTSRTAMFVYEDYSPGIIIYG